MLREERVSRNAIGDHLLQPLHLLVLFLADPREDSWGFRHVGEKSTEEPELLSVIFSLTGFVILFVQVYLDTSLSFFRLRVDR